MDVGRFVGNVRLYGSATGQVTGTVAGPRRKLFFHFFECIAKKCFNELVGLIGDLVLYPAPGLLYGPTEAYEEMKINKFKTGGLNGRQTVIFKWWYSCLMIIWIIFIQIWLQWINSGIHCKV